MGQGHYYGTHKWRWCFCSADDVLTIPCLPFHKTHIPKQRFRVRDVSWPKHRVITLGSFGIIWDPYIYILQHHFLNLHLKFPRCSLPSSSEHIPFFCHFWRPCRSRCRPPLTHAGWKGSLPGYGHQSKFGVFKRISIEVIPVSHPCSIIAISLRSTWSPITLEQWNWQKCPGINVKLSTNTTAK